MKRMKQSPSLNPRRHDAQTRSCPDLAPPWNSPGAWHEANRSVDWLIERHHPELSGCLTLFQNVRAGMASIFPMLDELCANTCPWCPDPCCLSATVWFDFSDLLFLHLSGQQVPPCQPQPDLKITCRYCGPRGCRLPRISRPWICTWYLCDSQLACLRKKGREAQETFNRSLRIIKTGRKEMEAEFIRVVAKGEVEESKG
ncbi:MAG: hypothetical protein GY846_03775 [Deltaproteobacteria bacterium]|nr:hypothetical protein [Deltaproteobacteria bacterium]